VYLNIKELSEYLKVKSPTLYAWVAQGKIPHVKIHGIIRFRLDEIDTWIKSFRINRQEIPSITSKNKEHQKIDTLIAKAKRESL